MKTLRFENYFNEQIAKWNLETIELTNENVEFEKLLKEVEEKRQMYQHQIALKIGELRKDLSLQRIQQFCQFTADESFLGDQCVICQGDIEIGRNMMRLDCDGQHTFCQVCIEGWFAEHKTCPICRHEFK